jgi:hypothetical protein
VKRANRIALRTAALPAQLTRRLDNCRSSSRTLVPFLYIDRFRSILFPIARIFLKKFLRLNRPSCCCGKAKTKLTNQLRPVNYEPKNQAGETRTENHWKNVPFASRQSDERAGDNDDREPSPPRSLWKCLPAARCPLGESRRAAYGRAVLLAQRGNRVAPAVFGSKQRSVSANVSRWPCSRAAMIVSGANSSDP